MNNNELYLLSVVLCGRNDNYLGDFKYRITTSINYLCRNAKKIGRLKDIEVIVVDWNSETPLSKELCLIKEARENVKFIVVPQEIAKKYHTSGQVFSVECAINAGIRRARGTYIMMMPADTLITSTSLQNLMLLLEGRLDPVFDPQKTMLNIGRKDIPWQVVEKKLDLNGWDRYLQLNCRKLIYQNVWHGLAGGYGAILMHKLLWHQSQGFLENYAGWGWTDIEIGLRINKLYPYIDLLYFGIFVFDMQSQKLTIQDIGNNILPKSIDLNNENWGLKTSILEELKGETYIISDNVKKDSNSQVLSRNRMINELTSTIVKKNIRGMDGTIPKENEWACLFPLTWFSSNFLPAKYLEVGKTKGCSIFTVTNLNESIEIYLINPVDNLSEIGQKSLLEINHLFREVRYKGFNHYIIGDKQAALIHLKQQFIGSMSFDLILFRVDLFEDKAAEYLKIAINSLKDNGGIIVTGDDNQLFMSVWAVIQKEFSGYISIVCKTYNTAFILKSKNDTWDLSDYEREEKILSKAWRMPKLRIYLNMILSIINKKLKNVYNKIRVKFENPHLQC